MSAGFLIVLPYARSAGPAPRSRHSASSAGPATSNPAPAATSVSSTCGAGLALTAYRISACGNAARNAAMRWATTSVSTTRHGVGGWRSSRNLRAASGHTAASVAGGSGDGGQRDAHGHELRLPPQLEAEREVQPDRGGVGPGGVQERRLTAGADPGRDGEHEPGGQTLAAETRVGADCADLGPARRVQPLARH